MDGDYFLSHSLNNFSLESESDVQSLPDSKSSSLPASQPSLLPPSLASWLEDIEETEGLTEFLPLCTSLDIRQNFRRVAAVDVNRFPQGFNNVDRRDFHRGAKVVATRVIEKKKKNSSCLHCRGGIRRTRKLGTPLLPPSRRIQSMVGNCTRTSKE